MAPVTVTIFAAAKVAEPVPPLAMGSIPVMMLEPPARFKAA
jgi:hypothetical protein